MYKLVAAPVCQTEHVVVTIAPAGQSPRNQQKMRTAMALTSPVSDTEASDEFLLAAVKRFNSNSFP